jgi:hypothetical protein
VVHIFLSPHLLEDVGAAREVDARELGVIERRLGDRGRIAGDHVDHAVGQARGLEQPHQMIGREHRQLRRLPDHGVAHERRGRGQVARDRREVERRDREHEALERPVLHAVPHAARALGLLRVDLAREVDVEAQEVDQLARRVDLGLVRVLGLAEHRGRVQRVPEVAGQQVRGLQEHGRPRVERHRGPIAAGLQGRVDRALGLLDRALVEPAELLAVIVRRAALGHLARAHLLAPDIHGDVGLLGLELGHAAFELLALGASGTVVENGLVERRGDHGIGVHRHNDIIPP